MTLRLYSLVLTLLVLPIILSAQSIGCDMGRYTNEVFEDYQVATVSYGRNINAILQNQILDMDIYMPANDDETERPLMIVAHGGSFVTGNRKDMDEFCVRLVKRGFVCATIDYRLWPFLLLGFPDSAKVTQTAFGAVSDMKAAVRYFRQSYEQGNPYGIDTNYISVGGGSAGAITAIHTAYVDPGDDLPEHILAEINAQGGFQGNSGDSINMTYSSRVHSVYNLSGAIFDTSWINPGDVPIFSIQGTDDETVPFAFGKAAGLVTVMGSQLIHHRAERVGVINDLISVEGGGHSNIYSEEEFAGDVNDFESRVAEFWSEEICGQISSVVTSRNDDLTIFPNPASSVFNVKLPEGHRIQSIAMTSLNGQNIPINYDLNGYQASVRVPDQRGIFVTRVSSAQGVYFQRIIIQ